MNTSRGRLRPKKQTCRERMLGSCAADCECESAPSARRGCGRRRDSRGPCDCSRVACSSTNEHTRGHHTVSVECRPTRIRFQRSVGLFLAATITVAVGHRNIQERHLGSRANRAGSAGRACRRSHPTRRHMDWRRGACIGRADLQRPQHPRHFWIPTRQHLRGAYRRNG